MLKSQVSHFAVFVVLAGSAGLFAAGKAEREREADALVKEALHREIYGEQQERARLLDEAALADPDSEEAMWHRGYVRHKNAWVRAEELPALLEKDSRTAAYRAVRGEYPLTAEGQLALADWCRERGMAECERAHLSAVLEVAPDHAEARARLGFRRIDGDWVSRDDLAAAAAKIEADRTALLDWRPRVEDIARLLADSGQRKRKGGEDKVRAIDDPRAIPALELILARQSEETALLVVEVLASIRDNEAALALARQAVYSPWERVRGQAAERLASRDKDGYVPALLANMHSPYVSGVNVGQDPAGRLIYRHTFMREGQNEREMLVLDTAYRRIASAGGDGEETLARTLDGAADTARRREVMIRMENVRTEEINRRTAAALGGATGAQIGAAPQDWWQWWNDQNEIYVEGEKPLQQVRLTNEIEVADRVSVAGAIGAIAAASQAAQAPKDCLAAGTTIWTATGPVAVDRVQIGDLVLSQNPDTGELAYKPVLATTIRPKSALVTIEAGGEKLQASGGHPFWVAGEGWVKARELQGGMELHGVGRTIRVSAVSIGEEEVETYNLVVADFNTYFAGQEMILSHDNTIRQPTAAIVPGLAVK